MKHNQSMLLIYKLVLFIISILVPRFDLVLKFMEKVRTLRVTLFTMNPVFCLIEVDEVSIVLY